jgi:hypothetical protein
MRNRCRSPHAQNPTAQSGRHPADKLAGLDAVIFAERDRKLEAARQRRARTRQAAREG